MGLATGSGTGVIVGVGTLRWTEGRERSLDIELRLILRRSVLMWTGGTERAVEEVGLGVTGAAGRLV